jgi:hypothetical protein
LAARGYDEVVVTEITVGSFYYPGG